MRFASLCLSIFSVLIACESASAGQLLRCESKDRKLSLVAQTLPSSKMIEVIIRRPGKLDRYQRVNLQVLSSKVRYISEVGYGTYRDALVLDLGDVAGSELPNQVDGSLHLHYDEIADDFKRTEVSEDHVVTCSPVGNLKFENSCGGMTPEAATKKLLVAASTASIEEAEVAIACGADVNAVNERGCTPVMLSIEVSNQECSVKPTFVDSLRYARGHYLFNLLFDGGAYLYPADVVNERNVIHKLVLNYEVDLLRMLIELGEDLNVQDKWGSTPLMLAADVGGDRAVEILVAGNADVTLTDKQGRTAYDRGSRLSPEARNSLLPAKNQIVVIGKSGGSCAPLQIETKRGEYTKLTLKAEGQMFMLTLPSASVSLMANAGGSASKTFKIDRAGTFAFQCGVHGGRQSSGKLTVK